LSESINVSTDDYLLMYKTLQLFSSLIIHRNCKHSLVLKLLKWQAY